MNRLASALVGATAFCAVSPLPAAADPVGITVLSSEYHISGNMGVEYTTFDGAGNAIDGGNIFKTYDLFSATPITETLSLNGGTVSSSTGLFSVSTYAWMPYDTCAADAPAGTVDCSYYAPAGSSADPTAIADGVWTFQAAGTTLFADLSWQWAGLATLEVVLTDLTANAVLYHRSGRGDGDLARNGIPAFSVDPTHVYSLHLNSFANSYADRDGYAFTAALHSVPEPPTATLAILGAVLCWCMRRVASNHIAKRFAAAGRRELRCAPHSRGEAFRRIFPALSLSSAGVPRDVK